MSPLSYSAFLSLLNDDLMNEIKHMMFYLHSSSTVVGTGSLEVKEFLLKQAESEMKHVQQFSNMLIGCGMEPNKIGHAFPTLTCVQAVLEYALNMETEVVKNYVQRIADAEFMISTNVNPEHLPDLKWIIIFLEEQIMDSRQDADLIKQLLS